jgi:hypothetical protein
MKQKSKAESKIAPTEWVLSNLKEKMSGKMRVAGNPGTVKCKYGEAVSFNGTADAIFLNCMPLTGMEQFTIEVIFQPASGGYFEQRFLHLGEVQGDRVLMELRSTQTGWYFDAYIKASDQQCTLIDPKLLHPSDQWYHLAYVIDHGKLITYVNGKKELEGNIHLVPLKGDKTSIGARQNEVSWFKGDIYKIRIIPNALTPKDFMPY